MHSNEFIKTEGWYDRSDYSRPIDLSVFNQLKSIYIHFDNKGLFKYYYPRIEIKNCIINEVHHLKLADYNQQDIRIEFP